jgi:hypothetical protein
VSSPFRGCEATETPNSSCLAAAPPPLLPPLPLLPELCAAHQDSSAACQTSTVPAAECLRSQGPGAAATMALQQLCLDKDWRQP